MYEKHLSFAGRDIAYFHQEGKNPLTIVYLHGFHSSKKDKEPVFEKEPFAPKAEKCILLKNLAERLNCGFLFLNYTGTGHSSGDVTDIRIGTCFEDAKAVINTAVPNAPLLLVGSSLGGWISLLLASHLKNVCGLIGIAAAPDFTDFVWNEYLLPEHKALLQSGKTLQVPEEQGGYCWTLGLFEEAKNYLILNKTIQFTGPVILLQGDKDIAVPQKIPEKIKNALASDTVSIHLIKGVNHAFSSDTGLKHIENAVMEMLTYLKD